MNDWEVAVTSCARRYTDHLPRTIYGKRGHVIPCLDCANLADGLDRVRKIHVAGRFRGGFFRIRRVAGASVGRRLNAEHPAARGLVEWEEGMGNRFK